MARRPTESSWDSDDDLLRDDSVGISAFPVDKEDDVDEDALLGGSDEETEYINTLTHEADSTTYDGQVVGGIVKEQPDTSREEMFELQIEDGGDEDFDEEITELDPEFAGHHEDSTQPTSSSFDQSQDEKFSHQGNHYNTSVNTSLNTTTDADTSVAEDNASESEEEEEDEEDRGHARFKSERPSVISLSTKLRVKPEIPDTLEISEEEQKKIEEFLVNKPGGRKQWRNNNRQQQHFQPRFRGQSQGYNRPRFPNQQWPRFQQIPRVGGLNSPSAGPPQQRMLSQQSRMFPPQQQQRMVVPQQQRMMAPQQQQQQHRMLPQQQQQGMLPQQQQQQQTQMQQPQPHKVHINPHFRRTAPQPRPQWDANRVVQTSSTVPVMAAPMTQQQQPQHAMQPQQMNFQPRGPAPQPQQVWGVPTQQQPQQQQPYNQQPIQMQFPPQSQTNFFQHPGSRPGLPMQQPQFSEPQRMPHDLHLTPAILRPQQLSMQPQVRQFRAPQPVPQRPAGSPVMARFRSPPLSPQGAPRQQFGLGGGGYGQPQQQMRFMSQQQQQPDSVGQPIQTLVQRNVQVGLHPTHPRMHQQRPTSSTQQFQHPQQFQPRGPNTRAQRPTMAPLGGQRAAPPCGPRMQQPANKPLTADEKKLLDRAKRFASDPPAISLKKRQADGASNVSPSPPKQVRLASGAQTAAVSAAKKITNRAALMRQQKQQQQQQQQQPTPKQPPQVPVQRPANSAETLAPKPKREQEELGYDRELQKKLDEQRELRERIRQQKEARRLANAQKRREELNQRLAESHQSPATATTMTATCVVPSLTSMTTAVATPSQHAVGVSTSGNNVPKKVVKRVLMTRAQYEAMKEGRQGVSLVGAGRTENPRPMGSRGAATAPPAVRQRAPTQTTNVQNRMPVHGNNVPRRFANQRTVIGVNAANEAAGRQNVRNVVQAEGEMVGGRIVVHSMQQTTHHVVDGRGETAGGGPCMVSVDGLAVSTTESKLRQLAKNIGPVQTVQLLPSQQKAIMRFCKSDHAALFVRRFNRHMLDLSMITVSLLPT